MASRIAGLRRAPLLPLALLLGSFALAGYALSLLAGDRELPRILLWFGGAVIAHDLLLFPCYALADRFLGRAVSARWPAGIPSPRNYLRVPVLASGLVLLLFLPGIIQQGAATYFAATGQTQQPFLLRWVVISGAFVVVSAVLYLARLVWTYRAAIRRRARAMGTAAVRALRSLSRRRVSDSRPPDPPRAGR